jgi:hypothetical protein
MKVIKSVNVRLLATTIFLVLLFQNLVGQDVSITKQKFVLFPHPHHRNWTTSIGFTATTLPLDITEEVRFRLPAVDINIIKKLSGKWYAHTRFNLQGIQNYISIGPRYTHPFTNRFSVALGNDVAFWFGFVNTKGIRTRGTGWQNFPNMSFGYRFNKQILLTFRAESIMNLNVSTIAGDTKVPSRHRFFSGSAFTVALEQPFFKKADLTLGFRAMYTNYFWQTWTLFEDYDRNIFFPQVIVGVIL